jgi:hypothetical protein
MNEKENRELRRAIWSEEGTAAERAVARRELDRAGISPPRLWARRYRRQLEWASEILTGVLWGVLSVLVMLMAFRAVK